jgi:lysophospholipase L1-like esterase
MSDHTTFETTVIKQLLLPVMNLKKRFPWLPGARTVQGEAAFIGISEDELMDARIRYDMAAKQAALELLKEDMIVDALNAKPFGEKGTIVAVGDGLTEDAQGWFEILKHVLEIGTEGGFRCVNAAVSGSTSLDSLRTFERDVVLEKPDWVIIALGSHDAMRLHGVPNRTLVSLAEFWENISAMESMAGEVTKHPVIWITPPPVDAEQMKEFPLFEGTILESDLHHYREVVASKTGIVVDPYGQRLGRPLGPWNVQSDGFHLSTAGHTETVRALFRAFVGVTSES